MLVASGEEVGEETATANIEDGPDGSIQIDSGNGTVGSVGEGMEMATEAGTRSGGCGDEIGVDTGAEASGVVVGPGIGIVGIG